MVRVMNSLSAGGGEDKLDSEPNSGSSLGPRGAGLGSTGSEYSGTNSEDVTFAEPKDEKTQETEQVVKE